VNLFGFDITGLEVPTFLFGARVFFAVLVVVAAVLSARGDGDRRSARLVLGIGAIGHLLAWFATMFPLPNVYGANGSMDRENHLGWANVVALGFSPLRTFQVNHLHFEPVWPLLSAIAAGFSVDNVALVFQWAPLVVGLAVLLCVRFAWIRGAVSAEAPETVAAFAAMGALLLVSVPGDFSGPFRDTWALTFLLKPNHALGLVLAPLAALSIARARDWKSRLWAGFALQLVGWAFVIHMALFVAGLAIFVLLSWVTRSEDRRRDAVDVVTAVGANLLIVSPYLVMLVVAYPFLQGNDAYRLSFFSERPLEAPMRMGFLLLLSAFGAFSTYRAGTRLGRILSSQWLAAHFIWQAFPILGFFGQAREQDEAFYWCRFWTGLFAGVGAILLARDCVARFPRAPKAASIAIMILLPSMLPVWWNPAVMDQYFVAARDPLPEWIAEPTRFIRERTDRLAVFTGDRNYARWIAAYGARRVLIADSLNNPRDTRRRVQIERACLESGDEALLREGRLTYGLRYVLATSESLPQAPLVTLDALAKQPHLKVVYDGRFQAMRVMILEILEAKAAP
jgi:hypothetical protein